MRTLIGYLIKTAMEEKVDTGYLIPYVENILKTYDDNSCDAPLIGKFCDLLEELYCRKNNWQKKKCITAITFIYKILNRNYK